MAMGALTTLATRTANAPSTVNNNNTTIRNAFNAAMETVSGHHHDGTNSRLPYGGLSGFTTEDMFLLLFMGTFRRGGL
jgi:hypothetical protein